MVKKNLFILLLSSIACISSFTVQAQDTDPDREVNIWAQQPVIVDGSSAEWHEPLNNYNTGTKLAFALANDRDNLYLIIESLDEMTTRKVISGGLTLTINTAGKKKDGYKINFLGMNRPPHPAGKPADSLTEKLHEEQPHDNGLHETVIHVIEVAGFKNIPDGALSVPNQQNIQIAAAFNERRDYICELAIPLTELGLKGNEVKAIAYNIKFNKSNPATEHIGGKSGDMMASGSGMKGGGGMGGGGMKGGRGGMGGGGGHGRRNGGMTDAAEGQDNMAGRATDFWIKYELAKPGDTYRVN